MNRLLIITIGCLLSIAHLSAQTNHQIYTEVYFATDKSELTQDSKNILNAFLTNVKQYPYYDIVIKGNTDSDGSNDYNQKLSEKRIASVKSYFLIQSISPTSFDAMALGENEPIADNKSHSGKKKNRRVDIVAFCSQNTLEKTISTEIGIPLSISTLFKELSNPTQDFLIEPDSDTSILCANGTLIIIPAKSFDVPVGTKIKFSVKEVLTKADMLLENLTTTAQNRLLNSGGMIKIETFLENGKAVNLKDNRSLGVKIPTTNFEPQMEYFYGSQPNNSKKNADWNLMSSEAVKISNSRNRTQFLPYDWYNEAEIEMSPIDNKFLAQYIYQNHQHFNSNYDNYYRILSNTLPRDTCQNLYIITSVEKTDSITKIQEQRGIGSFFKKMFTGSAKTITTKEAKNRTVKIYTVDNSLSNSCRALAEYGKANNIERMGWEFIHRAKYSELYGMLEAELGVKGYVNVLSALKTRSIAYDLRLADFKIKYEAKREKIDEINKEKREKWQKSYDKWLKIQDEAVSARLAKGNISKSDINYYFFQTNKLGWLNCDYFTKNDNPVLVDTHLKKAENLDVKIVFQDRMAAIGDNFEGDKVAFKNVPSGRKAWIVAMSFYKDGPSLAIQEIETGKEVPPLKFQKMSVAQMRSELGKLNAVN